MKLSIIVPIYNVELYLEECLQSLIIDDNNIEYILINDGSTDNSLEICEKFKNLSNVKIYNNTNHGVSFTRNFGISKAKGKWIMFVDSDDLLVSKWNIKVSKYLDKKDDVLFFSSNIEKELINEKKELLLRCIGFKKNNNSFSGPYSKLYKRKFLNDNNIRFDEKIINGEDMLFNCLCILYSNNISAFNEKIYKYRININSSTKKWKDNYILSDIEFRKILYSEINKNSILNKIEISEIKGFVDTNAKIGIIQRLAFSRDFSIFKKNAKVISKYKFQKYNKLDIKKRIILYLFNLKQYRLVYKMYVNKLDKLKEINNYFVDI